MLMLFSAHIFFDDAMEKHPDASTDYEVNQFVKSLVEIMEQSCKWVYMLSDIIHIITT